MSQEVKFLETLKKLGFPLVNKYSAANFESYFADHELLPFLEYFCSLDENNVLTPEELEEYASIPAHELRLLEEQAANETECLKEEKKIEEETQIEFLTEKLNHLEKKYDLLEEQKRLLLDHESVLLKEQVNCEAANKHLRRLFDDFSMNKVPQSIAQLSTTLESISHLISKLKDVSDVAGDEKTVLPFLNLSDIEEYFGEEEKLNNLVKSNLLNDFQFEDGSKTRLKIPGLSKENISKEILILNNSLKLSRICESKAVYNKIKTEKTAVLLNKFQDGYFDDVLDMSIAQLSNKCAEETRLNEFLNKKESLLLSRLCNAIGEHVDAQCRQIAIAHSNEMRLIYKNNLEKISQPLQYLLNQKARLELLNLLISIHQRHWQDIKSLLDQVFSFADSEKKSCLLRQLKIDETIKQTKVEEIYLDPLSIFYSAYKILNGDVENKEDFLITLSDVVKSIGKLSERKKFISEITEKNNEVIEALKQEYSDLEKMFSKGVDFDELMKVEQSFSTATNQVEVLLEEISETLIESEIDWQMKNKVWLFLVSIIYFLISCFENLFQNLLF